GRRRPPGYRPTPREVPPPTGIEPLPSLLRGPPGPRSSQPRVLPSDPWSLSLWHLDRVSGSRHRQSSLVEAGIDLLVDGSQGGAQRRRGLGCGGGEQRPQDAVVDLGVEDRECLA